MKKPTLVRGGKTLLAQAGIAVVRRKEWKRDYLGLVMDFYTRYTVRQFGQALAAWQRHQPLGCNDLVKAVFLRHLAAYLPEAPKANVGWARLCAHPTSACLKGGF